MSYSLKASGRLGKKLGKYYVYFMIFLCIFNSGCNVSKSGFENAVDSLKFVGGKYSWFVGFFCLLMGILFRECVGFQFL